MVKLHYHNKFESTDITPYVTFGIGGVAKIPLSEEQELDVERFFSYQIGSGANLPFSEITNVFAGCKFHIFSNFFHGFELGINFNL